jgi:hypothetical protein
MLESLFQFATTAHKQGRDGFKSAFPEPVMVVQPFAQRERSKFQTVSGGVGEGTTIAIARVRKREGANAFGMMITLGRASNNDIEIRAPDVSKFHAYIRHNGESWTITDAGSRFGTVVGEQQLGKDQTAALTPGVEVKLGSVAMSFLPPDAFFDYLLEGSED